MTTLCELEASGAVGWVDVAAVILASFALGLATGFSLLLNRVHAVELLAARELGRREGELDARGRP